MFKYLFSIIFIFLVSNSGTVYSQTNSDTTPAMTDTVAISVDSSANTNGLPTEVTDSSRAEINEDSLYIPVKDSGYLNSYTVRTVAQPKVNKYLADHEYEYANDPEYWKKDKVQKDSGSFSFWNIFKNKIVQWILLLGVIGVILYGIYILAKENNFRWLSSSSKQAGSGDDESALKESVDYEQAISKYQSEGNYRMAIRYMYLRLIRSATEKNVIQIRESSTNSEIASAFGSHDLAQEFRYLATAYEYIYFGETSFNLEIFELLKKKFDVFQQKLSV
jgi:hypothetical protein